MAFDCVTQLEKQLSVAESKVAELNVKIGLLEAANKELATAVQKKCLEHQKTTQELHDLRVTLEEEVCVVGSIEFRRGRRTLGKWTPYCPHCHTPAMIGSGRKWVHCAAKCGWLAQEVPQGIDVMLGQMELQQLGNESQHDHSPIQESQ